MKPYNSMYKKDENAEVKKEETVIEDVKPATEVKEEVKVESKSLGRIRQAKVVNCTMLNVRSNPSTSASVVEIINEGDLVDITGNNVDSFTKVHTKRGMDGYCMSEFLKEV